MSSSAEAPSQEAGGPAPSKLPLILALVNVVAMLGALGTLFYTHVIYKRPAITEASEAQRLKKAFASQATAPRSGLVDFDPVTINIAPLPGQTGGKPHYATIGFSIEIGDMSYRSWVERVRPLIMDKLVSMVGRLQFQDLNSVQGRYVLRSRLLENINQIIADDAERLAAPAAAPEGAGSEGGAEKSGGNSPAPASVATPQAADSPPDDLVTNVYFSRFIVQ